MNELSVNDAFDDIEIESFDFIWEEWEEYKGDVPLWQHIFCGSIAGLMEHVFMYPLDTIKTYIQTNDRLKCGRRAYDRCSMYRQNGNGSNINDVEAHKSGMYIDKKKFCTSRGCDGCIYKKTCTYENFCNMKMMAAFNKKGVFHASTLGATSDGLRKSKKNLRQFLSGGINVEQRGVVPQVVNKKFQARRYHSRIMNKNFPADSRSVKQDKCGSGQYNQLAKLRKYRTCNLFDKPPGAVGDSRTVGSSQNMKIHSLSRSPIRMGRNTLSRARSGGTVPAMQEMKNFQRFGITCDTSASATKKGECGGSTNKLTRNNLKEGGCPSSVNRTEINPLSAKKVTGRIIFKKSSNGASMCGRKSQYHKYGANGETVKNCNPARWGYMEMKPLLRKVGANHVIKRNVGGMKRVNNVLLNDLLGKCTHVTSNRISNTHLVRVKNSGLSFRRSLKGGAVPSTANKRYVIGDSNKLSKKSNFSFIFSEQKCANSGNTDCRKMPQLSNYLKLFQRTSKNVQFDHCLPSEAFKKSYMFQRCEWNFFTPLLENIKKGLLPTKWYNATESTSVLSNGKAAIMRNDGFNSYYSLLRNNNNIFRNNLCYVTKSYIYRNLFDRSIHSSSCKNNIYKKGNSNFSYSRFSRNGKSFNFMRSLFPNMSNGVNIAKQNWSLIRSNISNLYKGVNVVVLGCIPAHALYFSTFEYSKKYFSSVCSKNLPMQVRASGGSRVEGGNHHLDRKKTEGGNYKLGDLNYFGIAVSGFLATIAHDLIITPIDTLKQRLQLGINKNSMDSIKILREHGIRSLYLSLPITLLMNIPYQIIMICTNEKMKKVYFEYFCGMSGLGRNNSQGACTTGGGTGKNCSVTGGHTNGEAKEESKNTPTGSGAYRLHSSEAEGCEGGDSSDKSLSGNSDELIKLFIQQDTDSVNYMSKSRGQKYAPNGGKQPNEEILFKNVINTLENSSINDLSEKYDHKIGDSFNFTGAKCDNVPLRNNMWLGNYNNDDNFRKRRNEFFNKPFNHITSYFVCAGIGGGVAAVVTNPLDVIKTRIQTECFNAKGFNFYRVVSNLYHKEGFRSFFKGSMARMALCIPASAISWGTYETMKRFFKVNLNSA
ncbi:Mitochondrial carrier protein [Plasmodium coatneyi]|uniref:Mitochondrial carrier protein n=1 Tax=Plasmodium coatneyi TaxID=208452 RepID=A0A1B1DXQ8_9APIC|nr:Mitochondrial carrier protein [Plasmodium coatneyi]ANQ07566.1 Mitochondrial carrier protein [Plasmodium coatneyi]